MIQSPGLYIMSEEDYGVDPCPEPSLNQTIGKVLIRSCPYAAWYKHPRLNPDFSPKEEDKFNLANVAHRLLLGRGREFRTVNADDWRSKASQEQKQAIRNSGCTPILEHQLDKAASMVRAAKLYLKDHPDGARAFNPDYGDGEMVIACLDGHGCWTRAKVDWLEHRSPHGDNFLCVDYKTTDRSANPELLTRDQKRDWAFQAAFQRRILDHIKPGHNARFLFLVQEIEEPWLCSLNEPTPGAMHAAAIQVNRALGTWSMALNSGVWIGYKKTVAQFESWDDTIQRWDGGVPFYADPQPPPASPAKARGRPRMTPEQKTMAKARREATKKALSQEYIEERKEIDNGSNAPGDVV